MKRSIAYFVLIILSVSCAHEEPNWPVRTEEVPPCIRINNVNLTKIQLDSVYCSGMGVSSMYRENEIGYFDRYQGYLYTFDVDGKLLQRRFGFGNGPKEVLVHPNDVFMSGNGDISMFGPNLDVQINSGEIKESFFVIPFNPNNREPGDGSNYSTYSQAQHLDLNQYGNNLFYSLDSQHPDFNMAISTDKYLKEARHLAKIDLNDHTPSVIIKGFPSIYSDAPNKLMAISQVRFDIYPDGKFLISFEGTHELYICNPNGTPVDVFGNSGKDMDKDYLPVWNLDKESVKNYRINRDEKGYYGNLKIIGQLVFRTYRKGNHVAVDGLQIYENEILIADLDVPKGMEVIGKVGNKVISNVYYDEKAERLFFYEFEMEYQD